MASLNKARIDPVEDQEGTLGNQRSILNALRAPTLSDLTHKRKVDSNPPPKGKRRARGEGASKPKRITAARVEEFPDECLSGTGPGGAKLFCTACHEELSVKKTVIVSHIASKKHKTGKSKVALKETRERDIAKLLQKGDINHPVGETLPMDQLVYRIKVLSRVAPIMLIFNPVILFCNSCHPSLLFLLQAPIIPVIFFQINFLLKYTHNNLFTNIYRTK